jgi:hypothetical protein
MFQKGGEMMKRAIRNEQTRLTAKSSWDKQNAQRANAEHSRIVLMIAEEPLDVVSGGRLGRRQTD